MSSKKNKRAQISETMTWVVATVAIIIVLVISVSVVSLNLKNKKFELVRSNSDLLVTKSFAGYLLSDDGSGIVWEKIKDVDVSDLSLSNKVNLNTNLFYNIFDKYNNKYFFSQVLLKISFESCGWDEKSGSSKGTFCGIVLFNRGGLPSNMGVGNLFYNRFIIKNLEDKDTILELMLN